MSPPIVAANTPSPPIRTADAAVATQPTGIVTTVPVPAATHLYVQAGAFSSYPNAVRLQSRLGTGLQISTIMQNGQRLYRLRLGPFDELGDADKALARLSSLGSNDARIVVDQ
jgi:rare lipoprotein A